MIDIRLIESDPKLIEMTLTARGMQDEIKNLNEILELRRDWKKVKRQLDNLRHKRNVISERINKASKKNETDKIREQREEAKKIVFMIKKTEKEFSFLDKKIRELILRLPNLIEKLPKKEKIVMKYGREKKKKWQEDYIQLCKDLELIDFDSAREMSGEGFYVLKEKGAKLQRALINFCLDVMNKNNYREILPPILVKEKSVINSGHLPKFIEGMYKTEEFYLTPTEEVSLLNLYSGKTLRAEDLPINLVSYTPCFRTEKGATKPFIRTHQFDEVEIFKFTKQEESNRELKKMVKDASSILKLLKIPFKIKLLPAEDIAFQSSITYDIDVFSPKTGWLEVSSCSNCLDFQARRARIFYFDKGQRKLVHTLNGTALGINRLFVSLIENYQRKDRTIEIPKVLQKYTGFKKIIPKHK